MEVRKNDISCMAELIPAASCFFALQKSTKQSGGD